MEGNEIAEIHTSRKELSSDQTVKRIKNNCINKLRHWKLLPMRYHAGDIDTYKRRCEGPCIEGGTRTNASKNTPDSLSPVKTDSLTSLQSNPNMYISKVIDIQ
eukprot:gene6494-4678_t